MAVVTAHELGLRTRRGWVFRDVTLAVRAGDLVAITGPAGSGRTSLLLALAGHFTTTHGRLVRRGRAGIGYLAGVHDPEPGLTVAELVRERELLLRKEIPGEVPVEPGTLGRDLTPYQKQLVMLSLAQATSPALIVADDVDLAGTGAERAALWQSLGELADAGTAVIVTARELPGNAKEVPIR
jgi:ABC-2 type transport system ATP-binding protein